MSKPLVKFEKFALNVGKGVFDFSSDQFKIALTNTEPTVATDEVYNDITSPIAATNLDGANPFNVTTTSFTESGGTAKLIVEDLTLTATGEVGPFQYIVLYSDSATNKELVGYYDYGSAVTLQENDTYKVDWNQVDGLLTIA